MKSIQNFENLRPSHDRVRTIHNLQRRLKAMRRRLTVLSREAVTLSADLSAAIRLEQAPRHSSFIPCNYMSAHNDTSAGEEASRKTCCCSICTYFDLYFSAFLPPYFPCLSSVMSVDCSNNFCRPRLFLLASFDGASASANDFSHFFLSSQKK